MPISQELRNKLAAATQNILNQQNQTKAPYPGMTVNNQAKSSMITPGLSMNGNTGVAGNMGIVAADKAAGGSKASSAPTMTGTATNGLTVPMPGMGGNASQSNTPMAGMNAATNNSNVPMPSTGYGGASYGSNAATNRALEANSQYIKDPANRQSEIDRTLGVIQNRQAQGLDISAQTKYLNQLGYAGNKNEAVDTVVQTGNTVPMPSSNSFQYTPSTDNQIPVYNPAIPVQDEAAIRKYAEDQVARKLSDARLTADQTIANNQLTANQQSAMLKDNYDKMYETINEDRNLENTQNARRLSPFSGRSDYALGEIERNRARTDRENQDTLQTNQGNIAAQTAQLKQQIDAKYAALQSAAPDEREALFQSIKNDERNYDLAIHQQVSSDLLNNSQLQNTAFGQALQTFMTNYGVQQDKINNDAQYGGTYNGNPTYAAQQQQIQNDAQYGGTYNGNQTVQQQQQQWDNRFNYGQAIGQFGNGQQTVQYQQLQQQKAQQDWDNNFNQQQFDWNKAQQTWENAFKEKDFQQQMEDAAASRGLNWATLGQRQKEFVADQAFREKQFEYQQGQDELANQPAPTTYEDAYKDIDSSMYVQKEVDDDGAPTGRYVVNNPQGLEDYIFTLDMPEADTKRLYQRYGLKWGG